MVTVTARELLTRGEALALSIATALESGQRIPCAGSSEWLSENRDERAEAALSCTGCPAFAPCRAAGHREAFGVWAGIDRTPHRTNGRKAS